MEGNCLSREETSKLINVVLEMENIIKNPHGSYFHKQYVKNKIEDSKKFLYVPEVSERVKKLKEFYDIE